MGTRNLILVKINEEYKVAQYGQWDGYPEGQGVTVLDFLNRYDKDLFIKKCNNCRFANEKDYEYINENYPNSGWVSKYPQLHRDTGAKVLDIINNSNGEILLKNSISFAGDSLFCEWAYVIDFDNNTFEVFRGFNKIKLTEEDRFFDMEELDKIDNYEPIILLKKYNLDKLPTKKEFSEYFEKLLEEE